MSVHNLARMLAAVGAGMSGYAKGQEIRQGNERRKVTDAREDEQYARGQAKQAKADQMETDLAASQSDQGVEDVRGYDVSSMSGGAPEDQAVVGYKAAGQVYSDQGVAKQALYGVNSRAEKAKRAADVYAKNGNLEMAAKMQQQVDMHLAEGTDQALSRIQAAAPQLAEVDKAGGKVLGKVGAETADLYNNIGGRFKVSPDTAVEYFKDKDAAGQPFVNARVLGKDGKPLVDDVQGAVRMFMSAKDRLAAKQDESRTYLTAQGQAETARHNSAGERLDEKRTNASIADSAAQRGIQMAGLGLQRERLNMEKQSFKKQGLAGQIADIEEVTGVKLTAEEKKIMAGIKPGKGNKEADAVGAKIVESAVKTYQENTPNATTAQIATFRANLERDMVAARGNIEVDNALKADLGGKDAGSPEYAKAWRDAQSIGLSDKDLIAKGYKPPAKTVPNPMQQVAATAGAGRAPAPAGPRTPHPLSAPVNAGNYDRNRNAFDNRPADNTSQIAQQRAQLQGEVARLSQLVASGEGAPQFRAQQAARLDLYKRQLAAIGQ